MSSLANDKTTYEYPLNERLRYFLRYENIILSANRYLALKDDLVVLDYLRRLIVFIGNHDLRSELLQQLDHQKQVLHRYARSSTANQDKLAKYVQQNATALNHLHEFRISSSPYANHAFLTQVMRQLSLQSGACSFDFPQLQAWLQTPWEQRQSMLVEWLAPFQEFAEDINICLNLTRKSGDFAVHRAERGFFSTNPSEIADNTQMVRLRVQPDPPCYPVVSAGAQRLNIHFMSQQDFADTPDKTETDINFELAYCVI